MPAPGARAKAKALGLKTYISDKPCKNGHRSERTVSGGNCLECQRAWFEENSDHVALYKKQWADENAGDLKAYHAEYYRQNQERWERYAEENRETRNEQDKQRRAANLEKHRAYDRAYMKEYTKKNAEAVRAHKRNNHAKRRAAPGRHTAADIRALFEAQAGKCAYCEASLLPIATETVVEQNRLILDQPSPRGISPLTCAACGCEFGWQRLGRPPMRCPACRAKKKAPATYHVDHDIPLARGGSNDPSNLCLACPTCNVSKQDLTGAEFRQRRTAA